MQQQVNSSAQNKPGDKHQFSDKDAEIEHLKSELEIYR